jgi:hypothetical protein
LRVVALEGAGVRWVFLSRLLRSTKNESLDELAGVRSSEPAAASQRMEGHMACEEEQ